MCPSCTIYIWSYYTPIFFLFFWLFLFLPFLFFFLSSSFLSSSFSSSLLLSYPLLPPSFLPLPLALSLLFLPPLSFILLLFYPLVLLHSYLQRLLSTEQNKLVISHVKMLRVLYESPLSNLA